MSETAWAHPSAGAHGTSLPSFSTPSLFWLWFSSNSLPSHFSTLNWEQTNLTIKSEEVLLPGICGEMAQHRVDGALWLAGERTHECTAGGGMKSTSGAVAESMRSTGAPAGAALKGRGGCVGRGWKGEPATAILICVQLWEGVGNGKSQPMFLIILLLLGSSVVWQALSLVSVYSLGAVLGLFCQSCVSCCDLGWRRDSAVPTSPSLTRIPFMHRAGGRQRLQVEQACQALQIWATNVCAVYERD